MKRDTRPERVRLLDRWQAKARCSHTQYVAHQYWERLKPHLTSYEHSQLSIAWGHCKREEGPAELNELLGLLRKAWEAGGEVTCAADWIRLK